MTLLNFSRDQDNFSITINGEDRDITDWGSDDPALEFGFTGVKGGLKEGKGGASCSVYNIQRPQITIHVLPGSDDYKFLLKHYNSNATNIKGNWSLLSGGDDHDFSEGMFSDLNQQGRVATSTALTDGIFTLIFNKGGPQSV